MVSWYMAQATQERGDILAGHTVYVRQADTAKAADGRPMVLVFHPGAGYTWNRYSATNPDDAKSFLQIVEKANDQVSTNLTQHWQAAARVQR